MPKKALVIRCGAYGDMLIISPVFRALKNAGYEEVVCHTGQRGLDILRHNPFIDRFIKYEYEGVNYDKAEDDWIALEKKEAAEFSKNFAESLEVEISLHPRSPVYSYPKYERYERGNRNFYEITEKIAGVKFEHYRPDLFFQPEEISAAAQHLKPGKFNILWALSGSGANKAYPWVDYVMGELNKNFKDVHIITVGNERCQIIEPYTDDTNAFTNLSGKLDFRSTIVLSKIVDLVVSPDTGVLHASGAFETPKIGILGHTTIENVTKHFINDYSLEADSKLAECSPCFRLIYDHYLQCPVDKTTGAAWCMAKGQPPERIYERIVRVKEAHGNRRSASFQEEVPRVPPANDNGRVDS